ncbi:PREDICTED: uncharacterized protein LOC105564896 [Vollenhovia emeryi]|uniref:uncharacterized protein LOC105564896 n=1 Tax=Vollenhovia emeryi TaxID=411798 RepID=UPI0005F51761|nr:PREDICTED: uncharacterized protein LOC105564896 [Vollenhovia emeryi]
MASYDRSYEKNEVQYQRVHVGKDHVDFSYQFFKNSSTRYVSTSESSRNYKISTSWQERSPAIYLLKKPYNDSSDFYICIDLVFDEAVYPIRVSIYEMRFPWYNTKIWAHNSQENRWFPLWTDVMLIGTSKLILSKNSEGIFTSILKSVKNHHLINDNFTPIDEHAHWDIRHLRKNFSNYCTIYTRCKYLQKLDLTLSDISSSELKKFLEICGGSLTHLRLSNCTLYSNVLDEIAALCNNLQVLDLSYCIFEDLLNEPILSADVTLRVCKLLQRNPRICNLNLNDVGCLFENIVDFYYLPGFNCMDSIAIQLRHSCADLEILNISDCSITSLGIDALAECKNLRKLNIPNMYVCHVFS